MLDNQTRLLRPLHLLFEFHLPAQFVHLLVTEMPQTFSNVFFFSPLIHFNTYTLTLNNRYGMGQPINLSLIWEGWIFLHLQRKGSFHNTFQEMTKKIVQTNLKKNFSDSLYDYCNLNNNLHIISLKKRVLPNLERKKKSLETFLFYVVTITQIAIHFLY